MPNNRKKGANKKKSSPKPKLLLQGSAFGMSGSLLYEKKGLPLAKGISGRAVAPVNKAVAGGEIVCGSSVIFELPFTDAVTTIEINPGLSSLFPQISPTANLFTEYYFRKLEFRYVPRVSTILNGQVGICLNQNVQAAPPTSWTQLVSYEGACFAPVWDSTLGLFVRQEGGRYVRNSDYPPNSDPKTYDLGLLTVILDGYSDSLAGASPGYIVANYEVELKKRVLSSPVGCQIISSVSGSTTYPPIVNPSTTLIDLYPLLTQPTLNPMIQIVNDVLPGSCFLGFPEGFWLIELYFSVSATTTVNDFITVTGLDSTTSVVLPGAPGGVGPGLPDPFIATNQFNSNGQGRFVYGIHSSVSATGDPLTSTGGWMNFTSLNTFVGLGSVNMCGMICRLPASCNALFPDLNESQGPVQELGLYRHHTNVRVTKRRTHQSPRVPSSSCEQNPRISEECKKWILEYLGIGKEQFK